jgi:hypothetical protein
MSVSRVIEKVMHGLMGGGRNPGPVGSPRGTGASRLPDPRDSPEVKIKSAAGAVVTKSLQRSRTYKVDADIAPSAKQ